MALMEIFMRHVTEASAPGQRLDPRPGQFNGDEYFLEKLLYSIYKGECGSGKVTSSEGICEAIENHDVRTVTVTPVLQEAAAAEINRELHDLDECEDDMEEEEIQHQVSEILKEAIPKIFSSKRAGKLRLIDETLQQKLVDIYFPFISEHGSAEDLKKAFEEVSAIAAEFALFLQNRSEREQQP
ncbi:hypothetical protein BKA81DRAFT_402681 [Phyllosticta paracitricarpa]